MYLDFKYLLPMTNHLGYLKRPFEKWLERAQINF